MDHPIFSLFSASAFRLCLELFAVERPLNPTSNHPPGIRRAIRISGLAAVLLLPVAAGASPSLLGQWTSIITRHQPEQRVVAVYDRLGRVTREAGGNLLGSLAFTLRHENDSLTDDQGARSWEGGVDLPLKVFGQRGAFGRLADLYPELRSRHLRWLEWQSAGIARTLLDELLERRIRLDHTLDAEAQAHRLHELVALRERTGDASRLDLLLARRNLSQARAATVGARADLRKAVEAAALWGIELDEEAVRRLDPAPPVPPRLEGDPGELLRQHPRYRWIAARNDLQLGRLDLSLWESRPGSELFFGARRDRADGVSADTALILELRVPLGEAPAWRTASAERDQRRLQLQAELSAAERELRQNLTEARQSVDRAHRLLPVVREQLEAAESALDLSRQAYRAGDIGLQELLIAQRQQLEAQLEYALAEADLARQIRRLNQAAGILP